VVAHDPRAGQVKVTGSCAGSSADKSWLAERRARIETVASTAPA
jgi:hypothetical protein